MSRPLESFEFLNRVWDIRVLETQSLRSVFVFLLLGMFVLGMLSSMTIYQAVHLHRFDWTAAFLSPVFILAAFRYAPVLYRRLGR
jgi:Ni/Fe-hydrogenase subunit HybB-like protein